MKKKVISILFAIMLIFSIKNFSNAANATIQCGNTAIVGTPISISVSGSAVQWNLDLKVNGQKITETNSELENVDGNKAISFSGKYTPATEGELIVTLEGSITDADTESTTTSFASKKITVSKKTDNTNQENTSSNTSNSSNTGSNNNQTSTETKKSNVATLSNLGITPNDFSGFKANKLNYDTSVPNDVESVEIYAKKGHDKQTISGTGKKELKVGLNKFEIAVTAEDGTTKKTYTLNITREEKNEETTETENPSESTEKTDEEQLADSFEETFGLTELKIEGVELEPRFQTDIYEYKVEVSESIEKLNIDAIPTESDVNIEITGNENFQNGENIVTILVKSQDEKKTTAYQITVNRQLNSIDTYESKEDKIVNIIIIVAVIAAAIVLVILIIVIIVKSRRSDNVQSTYIPYGSILTNHDEKEEQEEGYKDVDLVNQNETLENQGNEMTMQNDNEQYNERFDSEEDILKEKAKKKKHQKGKRFK